MQFIEGIFKNICSTRYVKGTLVEDLIGNALLVLQKKRKKDFEIEGRSGKSEHERKISKPILLILMALDFRYKFILLTHRHTSHAGGGGQNRYTNYTFAQQKGRNNWNKLI